MLSPAFSPEFGIWSQAGKADWPIVRRGIVVALGKTDIEKGPENLFPGKRVAQRLATVDKQAKHGMRSAAGKTLLEGESVKMRSQLEPKSE